MNEIEAAFGEENYILSTLREQIVEHVFIGDALRPLVAVGHR
ncbi:hypothetical protein [Sphingobium sp. BHU LFT2]|nr:hypothetical protein [Sphingobium sp. BHU LFT2]